MDNLGDKIKELRINNHLTQQEFANMLYVSNKTVSSWECNRTIPDINMLFKISSILNVSFYTLIDTNYCNLEPLEIEVKLKVNEKEFNRLLNRLQKEDSPIYKVIQEDTYYVPTYKKFDNEWLRVRDEDGKHILTYKKKIEEKCCNEYETLIDNYENFEKILFHLGMKKKGTITKKRKKILYRDKYEFAFDEVKNIGLFAEVEIKKRETDKTDELIKLIEVLKDFNIDLKSIDEKRYFDYL